MAIIPAIRIGEKDRCGCSAGGYLHALRSVFGRCIGWVWQCVCLVDAAKACGAAVLGAGQPFRQRGGATVFAGVKDGPAADPHHAFARRRCFVGHGRGLGLCNAWRGDRRAVGRAAKPGFYGDTALGDAGRGRQSAVLADPPCCHTRFKCCSKPLAHYITAVRDAPARCPGPRQPTLEGGFVPVTPNPARHLGGNP